MDPEVVYEYNKNESPFFAIPGETTQLHFGNNFNQKLKIRLPTNLTEIRFGNSFNQPLNGSIQKNVKRIYFGNNFNQPIDPEDIKNVTEIYFGRDYNHPIIFKDGIKIIRFGFNFNQSIKGSFPNTLSKLEFGDMFNHPISGLLPDSLNELKFGKSFNQPATKLPVNLSELRFGNDYNQADTNLSEDLEVLHFGNNFNKKLDYIPLKVWYLIIGKSYEYSLANKLPPKLSHLNLYCKYDQNLIDTFPKFLSHLDLSYKTNVVTLPNHLKRITYSPPSIPVMGLPLDPDYVYAKFPPLFGAEIKFKGPGNLASNVNIENYDDHIKIPNGSIVTIDDVSVIVSSTKDGLDLTPKEAIDNKIVLPIKTIIYRSYELGIELISPHEATLNDPTEVILREDTWIRKCKSSNIMKVSECVAKINFSK
uniref:Uncharacterized protein n=1 Tax=viral metagenome TaxID=1070528 RepID=A0A6C0C6M7_9ZZZZ